ncbi:MAG: EF-hand domain-containing protein, partial [Polyangiaceae bacterium]
RALVDWPYGTPSGHIFESENAVLIGAGIGVTPFASILESIVLRANGTSEWPSKLKKVHFFWLNRDRHSFEWFAALLSELERIDQRRLLDVHAFMTGGHHATSSAAVEVGRELLHEKGESDLVTGLRAKTRMGRPDWNAELTAIREAHAPAIVDVFFCGPRGFADEVRATCVALGMRFRDERF